MKIAPTVLVKHLLNEEHPLISNLLLQVYDK